MVVVVVMWSWFGWCLFGGETRRDRELSSVTWYYILHTHRNHHPATLPVAMRISEPAGVRTFQRDTGGKNDIGGNAMRWRAALNDVITRVRLHVDTKSLRFCPKVRHVASAQHPQTPSENSLLERIVQPAPTTTNDQPTSTGVLPSTTLQQNTEEVQRWPPSRRPRRPVPTPSTRAWRL
jgi:hypothetical protein